MRPRLFGTALALPTAMTMYSYTGKDLDTSIVPEVDDQLSKYKYCVACCESSLPPPAKVSEKTLGGSLQPLPARDEVWKGLSRDAGHFDVLVIGGGATGTGCALDAQTRCVSYYASSMPCACYESNMP